MQISALWAFLASLAAVAVAVAPALAHWRYRAGVARTEPARLLDPPPRTPALDMLAALLAFAGVALGAPGGLAPLTTLIGAYAIFVLGHRNQLPLAGTVGLLLVGLTVARVALEWLPWVGFNVLLGFLAASWLLHWFAIFWHQQLLDGRPWTTAGALAPRAETLSYVFLAAALIAFGMIAPPRLTSSWAGGFLALVMLAMCIGFARRAGKPDARLAARRAARVASYGLLLIATVPVCVLLAGIFGWHVSPVLLAACFVAGILLFALL